jgi:hypothetical protein
MEKERIKKLRNDLAELKERYREREASIPAHSIRPHQLIELEELEEAIQDKEAELIRLTRME